MNPGTWMFYFDIARGVLVFAMIPPQFLRSAWSTMDIPCHVGGALTGLLGVALLKRRRKQDNGFDNAVEVRNEEAGK